MRKAENILISVEHKYVAKMLDGAKTAELRRRQLRIQQGDRIWVYSKLPRGHVELVATVEQVIAATPGRLWRTYQDRIAIDSSEFKAYLSGVHIACVILLENIRALQPALKLDALQRASGNFHPPQFFKRLSMHGAELKRLTSSFASH